MTTPEMKLLEEIQETQIIILSKLFNMERRAEGHTKSGPADYTEEVHKWIKDLREHVRLNGRTILTR